MEDAYNKKIIDDVSNSEINDFLLPTYNHKRHASQQHGGGSFIVMSVELKKTAKVYVSAPHTKKLNLWLSPSASQRRNPCFCPLAVYQDLNRRHDWPVKNWKRTSGDSLSQLSVHNKDLGGVRLIL